MRPVDEDAVAAAVEARLEAAIDAAFAPPSTAPGSGVSGAPDLAAVAVEPAGPLRAIDPTAVEHADLAWAADGGRVLLATQADAPSPFEDDFGTAALAATRAGYWVVRAWYADRPAAAPAWRAADVREQLGTSDGFLTAMADDWYRISCDLPGALLERLLAVARAHLDGHEIYETFALRAGDLREAVVELVSVGAAVAVLELAAVRHLGGAPPGG